MSSAIPSLETVVDAVKAELDALAIGSVLKGFHGLEDDVEFIENGGYIASGSMDLFFIDIRTLQEIEGRAPGEMYERYPIEIRYWSLRTNDPDWSRKARLQAEAIRDQLAGNPNIFAISGQRQLITPETVQIDSHGPSPISGTEGEQLVYQTVLSLAVEARRWSFANMSNPEYIGATASTDVLGIKVVGDTYRRLNINADGSFDYGPGSSPYDLGVGRVGVGAWGPTGDNVYDLGDPTHEWRDLYLAGRIWQTAPAASTVVHSSKVSGDSQDRWTRKADGTQSWGPGNAIPDLQQYRSAAGIITFEVPAALTAVQLALNAHSGNLRSVTFRTDGTLRNLIGTTNSEVGANSGTDLLIQSRDDAGATLRNDLILTRSSGTWTMGGVSGIVVQPGTDNVSDFGGSSNRWRDIRWGRQAIAPDGSDANPSYTFSGDINGRGFRNVTAAAKGIGVIMNGVEKIRLGDGSFADYGIVMTAAGHIAWNSTTLSQASNPTPDLVLRRGAAGILSQSNGANGQTYRLFNNTDSDAAPANAEFLQIVWSANTALIQTRAVGTGTSRVLSLGTNATAFWDIGATTGHFIAHTDNANDAGSASNRIRSGFFGTSISIGTNPATSGDVRLISTGAVQFRNAANSANIVGMSLDASDNLQLGSGAGFVNFNSAMAIGGTPAGAGNIRMSNNNSIRFRNGANSGDIRGLQVDANNVLYLAQDTAVSCWLQSGGALATTATTGYVGIPSCAGAPTGVPANIPAGTIPMVYDTTNNKIWFYNGSWRGVVVA